MTWKAWINFDENLKMSTGDKKTDEFEDEFDQEVGDDEPNWLNDCEKIECGWRR